MPLALVRQVQKVRLTTSWADKIGGSIMTQWEGMKWGPFDRERMARVFHHYGFCYVVIPFVLKPQSSVSIPVSQKATILVGKVLKQVIKLK